MCSCFITYFDLVYKNWYYLRSCCCSDTYCLPLLVIRYIIIKMEAFAVAKVWEVVIVQMIAFYIIMVFIVYDICYCSCDCCCSFTCKWLVLCYIIGKMKAIVIVGECDVMIIATYIPSGICLLRVGNGGAGEGYVVSFGFVVNTP